MTPRQRMSGLLIVLGVTVAAIADGGDGELEQAGAAAQAAPAPRQSGPVRVAPHAAQAGGEDPLIDLERLARRRPPGDALDVFAAHSWQPPPPPAPKVVEPPKPVAPPLPFMFMGRMIEDDKPIIFLRRGDEPIVVRERDVIEKNYRVDGIGPSSMVLTYLPLGQQQVLSFGSRIDASQ